MRVPFYVGLMIAATAGSVAAKLPPPTEDAKLKAAEAAAKTAWNEKVGLYKHCQVLDKIAANYRKAPAAAASAASAATVTAPACVDPGPFVSPALATASAPAGATVAAAGTATAAAPAAAASGAKPLEAAGAHSPSATATTPPNSRAPAAAGPNTGAAANAGTAPAAQVAGGRASAPTTQSARTPITPVKDKPIEMSEAHSPPGTAISPPSTKATNAELTPKPPPPR